MLDLYLYNKISSLDKKRLLDFQLFKINDYMEIFVEKKFFFEFYSCYKQFIGIIKIRFIK